MKCLQMSLASALIANGMTLHRVMLQHQDRTLAQPTADGPSSLGVQGSRPSTEAHGNRNCSSGISSRNRNRNGLLEPHMLNFPAASPGKVGPDQSLHSFLETMTSIWN